MPSAYALGIVSGNSILDFGEAERLRAFRFSFFTGRVVMGNGSCKLSRLALSVIAARCHLSQRERLWRNHKLCT